MNFKKFISGVSALTIAASAFAGMAVTASADESTKDATLNSVATVTNKVSEIADGSVSVSRYGKNSGGAGYLHFTYDEGNVVSATLTATATWSINNKRTVSVKVNSISSDDMFTENVFDTVPAFDKGTTMATSDDWQIQVSNKTKALSFDVTKAITGTDAYLAIYPNSTNDASLTVSDFKLSIVYTSESIAAYKVNYLLNGTPVKTVETTGIVGQAPEFSNTTIVGDDNVTYIYVSDDSTGEITDDGNTVVNVNVRAQDTYTASITSSLDNSVIKSQENVLELSSATLYHNRFIVKDGVAYKSTIPASASAGYDTTLSYTDQTAEITYEKALENVAYYSEGEDIADFTVCNDTARMSGGKGGYGTTTISLPAGKYVAYVASRGGGSQPPTYTMTAGETKIYDSVEISGSWNENESAEFTLESATDLTLTAAGASNKGIDYILIVKTGDVETTPADTNTYKADKNDAVDFVDRDNNENKASLWSVTAAVQNPKKVVAVVSDNEGVELGRGEDTFDTAVDGNVQVYVVVNHAVNEIANLTISFE